MLFVQKVVKQLSVSGLSHFSGVDDGYKPQLWMFGLMAAFIDCMESLKDVMLGSLTVIPLRQELMDQLMVFSLLTYWTTVWLRC